MYYDLHIHKYGSPKPWTCIGWMEVMEVINRRPHGMRWWCHFEERIELVIAPSISSVLFSRSIRLRSETYHMSHSTSIHFNTCFSLLEELFGKSASISVKDSETIYCVYQWAMECSNERFFSRVPRILATRDLLGVARPTFKRVEFECWYYVSDKMNIEINADGFRFLDVACAPGGFSQFLLDGAGGRSLCLQGFGITLPPHLGGFEVIIEPVRFSSPSYHLCYYE